MTFRLLEQEAEALLAHVELQESRLVQVLPQDHLHAQVVVDEEAHPMVGAVKVVVRVALVVGRHEAVRTHLQQPERK